MNPYRLILHATTGAVLLVVADLSALRYSEQTFSNIITSGPANATLSNNVAKDFLHCSVDMTRVGARAGKLTKNMANFSKIGFYHNEADIYQWDYQWNTSINVRIVGNSVRINGQEALPHIKDEWMNISDDFRVQCISEGRAYMALSRLISPYGSSTFVLPPPGPDFPPPYLPEIKPYFSPER